MSEKALRTSELEKVEDKGRVLDKSNNRKEFKPQVEEVFIWLPVKGDPEQKEYPVDASYVAELKELFPAVDVEQELREMRSWLLANPQRQKTKRGIKRFIHTWLSKEQDRARRVRPIRGSPVVEENQLTAAGYKTLMAGMRLLEKYRQEEGDVE